MGYADPNFTVRRESFHTTTAGATTESAKFRSFQAMRLKKVHVAVVTAGTAAGHGLDIYHGTTSIGTIALGTSVAGVVAHSALLDRTVGTMEQISVKTLADTVGIDHVVYEYEVTPDAVAT